MSKKIATIAYLKELYGKLGLKNRFTSNHPDTYCPTYGEITESAYYIKDANNTGLLIGSQYSVDDSTDKTYAPNQCVCEIDIMAMKPTSLQLSLIQSGSTKYATSGGTVDCMVTYEDLTGKTVPYDDNLPYLKVELKGLKYQKKDDGQEITSENTNVNISNSDSISYSGSASGLTDNISTKEITGKKLYAVYSNSLSSNTITINQLGETYGYYDSNNEWVNAEDYSYGSYTDLDESRITTGWLDDYGDNTGIDDKTGTPRGRDIYNTDSIDYRRGIEVTTDIDVSEAYTAQSMSNSPEHFGDHLPSGATKTYHIAFANDANSGKTGDSLHWIFKEEDVSSSYKDYCNGGYSRHQCSLKGYSNWNDYSFSSHRDYFKPQHCYGRTSIDRIYKKDTSGNIRVDKDGNKMIDKGFSSIDHLQGNYPKHWRRLIATYRQNQDWDTLTADTESMAKVTIYEKNSNSNEYKPSHRLVNGSYRVSSALTTTDYAEIYFPDNTDGNETYYAYPFFHYLSPENCKFDDDDKKTTYHRDSAHTLTNYEGGESGKTYAYNMSIGEPDYPMIQDNGQYYLTYYGSNNVMTYENEYCPTQQKNSEIRYIGKYTGSTVLDNVILYRDVDNYLNYSGYGEPTRKTGFFTDGFSDSDFSVILPYNSSEDTSNKSYDSDGYQSAKKYTIISDDTQMPNSREEWRRLLDDDTKWTSHSLSYFYKNTGNQILERFEKTATVPYQKGTFMFNANSSVNAEITGDLGTNKVATASVDNANKTVTVTINYGENFEGSAYTGRLHVWDNYDHNLYFPITCSEEITMAEAREIAANDYGAINDANNYWCRDGKDGQGDKGKEYLTMDMGS